MTSSPESPATTPQRGGIELLPLLMVGAVAVMLAIAGRIDRGAPAVEAKAIDATEVVQIADASSAEAEATGAVSDAERTKVEGIIRDYLLKNPEILAEVQDAYQAKAEAKREAGMVAALKSHAKALYQPSNSPSVGAPEADVTVVEFFDYNCGYCKRAMSDIAKLTTDDPKVKFVFKEMPIFGKDSEAAARIAIAAQKQGKYWELHQSLLSHDGKLSEESALSIAEGLGLDMAKLKADMALPETQQEIDETHELARKLGVEGTPHFFVGDQIIPGAPEDLYDQLQSRIADVRKSGCSIC